MTFESNRNGRFGSNLEASQVPTVEVTEHLDYCLCTAQQEVRQKLLLHVLSYVSFAHRFLVVQYRKK